MKQKLFLLIFLLLVSVSLDAQTRLKGRIVNSAGGEAVENALVSIRNYSFSVKTKVSGVFEFIDIPADVSGGVIIIEVKCEGFAYREFTLERPNASIEYKFEIDPELSNSNVPVALVDETLVDDDSEGSSQEISTLVTISNDAYLSAVNFQLSPFRFKTRGYNSRYEQKYINGVSFNDQLRGVFNFAAIGALNDLTRNGDGMVFMNPSSFTFGSIGGAENINMRAANFGKGMRLTASYTNRHYYLRGIASYSTGLNDKGWAFTAALGGRYADKGAVAGTFYSNLAYAFAVEKQWNGGIHSLSFTTFGSPVERGQQSASYQEAFDLLENNLYNPNWGYQNGKVRNSHVIKSFDPTGIISYIWRPDRFTSLTAGVGVHYGRYGSSSLNWFGSDPRPDYYRYLPSFNNNDAIITEFWKNKDPAVTQIDWDKLYYANHYSRVNGDGAAIYLLEERRSDLFETSFNATISKDFNNNSKLDAGIGLRSSVSDQFKTVDDLLGAKYVLDIDKFAEQDFPTNSDIKQNDLNKPNRKPVEGSVYGYDFKININSANFWIQNRYATKMIDFYYATKLSYTEFQRDGKMRNGRYPDNSYGKGIKHSFVNMALKGGVNYKITGRHFITFNASYGSEAPLPDEVYISPRISDNAVPDAKSSRIMSLDLNYIYTLSAFNGRISVFQTNFYELIQRQSYYYDVERTFVHHVLAGLNKVNRGVEAALVYKPDRNWTFSFAGTWAEYYYASNPEGIINFENGSSENKSEKVYLKNYYVGGTPQIAGTFRVNYFYKYWFFGANLNLVDRHYIDIASLHRIASVYEAVTPVDETYEAYKILTSQERFDRGLTVDLSLGKIFYLRNKRSIIFNLSLANILNNRNIRISGYEQGRLDLEAPNKFAAKYYYMQGINGFVNISYRF